VFFNFALVMFATNLLCVWFRVAALVVHRRKGGFWTQLFGNVKQ
jgi:hypothetical protein